MTVRQLEVLVVAAVILAVDLDVDGLVGRRQVFPSWRVDELVRERDKAAVDGLAGSSYGVVTSLKPNLGHSC